MKLKGKGIFFLVQDIWGEWMYRSTLVLDWGGCSASHQSRGGELLLLIEF